MVMPRTTSSSRMASRVTVVVSAAVGSSPVTRAYNPWAADLAQPPQTNAKNSVISETGIHRQAPGATRPNGTRADHTSVVTKL